MRNGDDRLGNYHEWSLINVTIAYSLRSSILSFLRRLARATSPWPCREITWVVENRGPKRIFVLRSSYVC